MGFGAPSSETDVVNMALDYMGAGPVQTVNPATSETAKLMARHYGACRRSMLRQYIWRFAEAQATIYRVAETPAFDYADAYQLPNDFIRYLRLSSTNFGEDADKQRGYRIQGRLLLLNQIGLLAAPTNEPSVDIYYVKDVEDVGLWDSLFVKLVALNLAISTAYTITRKASVVSMLNDMLATELTGAIGINSQETPPIIIENSPTMAIRNMGRRGESGLAGPYTEVP